MTATRAARRPGAAPCSADSLVLFGPCTPCARYCLNWLTPIPMSGKGMCSSRQVAEATCVFARHPTPHVHVTHRSPAFYSCRDNPVALGLQLFVAGLSFITSERVGAA